MKKIITLLTILAISTATQARCNWSGYWMKKVNQQQNVFTFQTNIHKDTCVDYQWIIYDYQLKRNDTMPDWRGFTQIQFNTKGKYRVTLKATDKCDGCDTTFKYEVDITIFGKVDVLWKVGAHHCKYYIFELTNLNDTCAEYYYTIYKGEYFDTMSQSRWENITDSSIYNGYDFPENDLVYYNLSSQRSVIHEFQDSGRHLVVGYWLNRCTGIDTFVMRKIEVCTNRSTSGITKIIRPEPKLIGIYDMMGRRVYAIRKNEVLIYIYDDGSRKKIVQE